MKEEQDEGVIQPIQLNDREMKRRKKKELIATRTINYMNNKLQIQNNYTSLISLINTIYPPSLCPLCDTVFTSKTASNNHFSEKHKRKLRYLCIHPHCDQRFLSRGALHFHIQHSHLILNSENPLPDPPFIQYSLSTTTTTTNGNYDRIPSITTITIEKKPNKAIDTTTTTTPAPTPTATAIISSKKRQSSSSLLLDSHHDDLFISPSPPPSPFSLYHHKSKNKKPILSQKAENLLNDAYPPLQCPSCQKAFNRKTNVIKHLTDVHFGEEPYRCIYSKCNHPRIYATREGLVYHISRVHDH
ncbi:MAG: hypothetical protein EXX96DRAFT_545486 [Benjaminiella poitrasii]|nr:MAG: hypothetical protein EXX96DRAFT_545486 [Benjaminiella poitrasii]